MHDNPPSLTAPSRWLNALYLRALQGGPGIDSAHQLAERYRSLFATPQDAIPSLIRREATKAATSGFLLGLGGVVALPVTLPVSLAGPLLLQFRLIATIALLAGFDVDDPRTRHLCYLCLGGAVAKDTLQTYGTCLLRQMPTQAVEHLVESSVTRWAVRLPSVSLRHLVPVFSGVVNGSLDYLTVRSAGALACKAFLHKA